MKYSFFLMFFCVFHLAANHTTGQNATMHVQNETLSVEQFLKEIEKQTDYMVIFSNREVDTQRKVHVSSRSATVSEYLANVFEGTDIRYEYENDYIILTKRLSQSTNSKAQKGQIVKGTIVDKQGEPLPGVNVIEKGSLNGTITDVDGQFSIQVTDNKSILVFSYIGYVSQEIAVNNQSSLKVTLLEDALNLEEVVVVGYGAVRKKDLTGAVSSVKFDDAPMTTFSSVSQALAGKAAGLQASTISAQPGGQTNFNIRGATSTGAGNAPLIVIDGFPVSEVYDPSDKDKNEEPGSGNRYKGGVKDNTLATLNPNDIESIVILKDASATAIYGARAGHGVILVTTKRGSEGKVKVEYAGNMAFQSVSKRVETLGASDWMREYNRYQRDRYLFDNKMGVYSPGGNSKPVDWSGYKGNRFSEEEISNPKYDTDWVDDLLRTGSQQQHSLTMSGGSQNTKYLTSVSFFDQKGVIRNNNMKRFNARVNLDQQISKFVKAGLSLNMNQNKFDNVGLGDGANENAGVLVTAVQSAPIRPIKDEQGNYTLNPQAAYFPNSSSLLEIKDNTQYERILANAFIEAKPIQDLTLKASLGFDKRMNKRKTYLPKTTLYGQKTNGQASISSNDKNDYLLEITANYAKTIRKHNLNALAGYSFQDFNWEGYDAGNQDFLIDGFSYNNLGAGAYSKPQVGSFANKSQMASFFGRINYIYDNKYYLTTTLRADGASNLAEGNQWGYFPSVALAWNISNESFFEPIRDQISQAKLRVSYGETGNSNIGNKARDFYRVDWMNYLFGNTEYKGVFLGQMGNKNLQWETTTEVNAGLDLELFSRVNISAEVYKRTISDLLSERNLMSYHEVEKIAANIGQTESKGFELTISSRNVESKDFSWTSDLTFSFYRDRWKERDPSWKPAVYENERDYIRAKFGFKSDGLITPEESGKVPHMPGAVAGQVKLKDLDGFQRDANGQVVFDANGRAIKTGIPDGMLDDADKVYYGNKDNEPGYLFGFNNTLTYKNFDLNFYMYGIANQMRDGDYHTGVGPERIYTDYGMPAAFKEYWSSENPNTKYYGLFQSASSWGAGDYLVKKVWYLRMRNITLGYTVPLKTKNIIQGARVYVDVNNLFILTNYKGLDPETDSYSGGISAYPNVRSFSLGVNVTF